MLLVNMIIFRFKTSIGMYKIYTFQPPELNEIFWGNLHC